MEDYRYNELLKNVSTSMMMKMKQIKRFVDGGKASVMVGAGFSKNAIMDDSTTMKNWDELAVDFYSRLYLKKPEGEDLSFKTPMRLASQIKVSFGRNELEELIINSLPDDRIVPSDLHKSLVEISWKDIFTTNYDTLLERVCTEANRYYEIITNKETLLYKKSPRLIKLHGSFPNIRPFIITEEDYRTYSDKYPEFVNTVRQSLIEGLLCLIGFSGDDPNFLNWLGWFRDIMGNQSAPVYMITYNENFHTSEMKLLNSRGIEPINLAEIKGIYSDICEGLDFFLTFLGKESDEQTTSNWNAKIKYAFETEKDAQTTIEKMSKIRKTYPGWVVLPASYDNQFEDTIMEFPFLDSKITGLNKTNKLNFIYELDWRLSISLTPKDVKWYRDTLFEIVKDNEYIKNKDNLDKLNSLKISLLSIYRLNLEKENYYDIDTKINKDVKQLSGNLLRKYDYERCLYYVSILNYEEAEKILSQWNVSELDYIGTLWKSAILAELGEKNKASLLRESAYRKIRSALLIDNSSPFLLSCFAAIKELRGSFYRDDSSQYKEQNNYYNIENIKNSIKNILNTNIDENISIKHDFNIEKRITTWKNNQGEYVKKYFYAQRYLMLYEQVGFQFDSNLTDGEIVIPNVITINTNYSLSVIVRSNSNELLKDCLTRKVIKEISRQNAELIFKNYIKEPDEIEKLDDNKKVKYYNIVLPLLSRLSVKLSHDSICKLIKIHKYVFTNKIDYYDSDDLKTLYNCIPPDKMDSVLDEVYSTEIKNISPDKQIALPKWGYKNYKPSEKVIDIITQGLKSKDENIRNSAYIRLSKVYESLNQKEKDRIENVVLNWRNSAFSEISYVTGRLIRSSYSLVSHKEEDKKDINEYYNEDINKMLCLDVTKINHIRIKDKIYSMPYQKIEELTNYLDNIFIEAESLKEDHIKKLTDVLNENQDKLTEDNFSLPFGGIVRHPLNSLFTSISQIIVKIDISKMDTKIISNFLDAILKYESTGFPCLAIITKLNTKLKRYKKNEIDDKIDNNLFSESKSKIDDAILAIRILADTNSLKALLFRIIDNIEFSQNISSHLFLNLLIDLYKKGKHSDEIIKKMPKLLERLYNKIDSDSMDEEYKTDINFYANKLAGALSTIKGNEELSKAVNLWRNYSEDENTFNDVKVGFSLGEEMINDK